MRVVRANLDGSEIETLVDTSRAIRGRDRIRGNGVSALQKALIGEVKFP